MKMHPRILPYAQCPTIAIDTETTGLDWWDRRFRVGGYVMYDPDVGGDYVPVGHETIFDDNQDGKWVADSIAELAKDKSRTWLMHNRGYDENVCRRENILFAGPIIDTMGLWWVINPHPDPNFSLKGLGARHIESKAAGEQRKLDQYIKSNKLKRYTQVPVEIMAPYAIQDGALTWKLWEAGMKRIPANQMEVHDKEQEWIGLLSRMAARGVPVDRELAQEIIDNHLAEAHRIRVRIASKTGIRGFNPTSPQQVMLAASQLGGLIEDTTQASLEQSSLPRYFREGVVRYRKLMHTVGSYLEPMISISRNSIDGRVHTSFRTTTKTGRLASSDPINLQGLPKQGDDDDVHRVRETVRFAEDERALGFSDFAQIDVRVGAHYAQDPLLLEVLRDPEGDIHSLVQSEVQGMGIELDRRKAKELVFGSQYGIGKKSFAAKVSGLSPKGKWVSVSEREAGTWLDAHRKRFPAIPYTLAQAEQVMKSRGYIMLYDGRVVGCPPDEDPHKAFAWLIQGTGAQIIKRAMTHMEKMIDESGLDGQILLQIHDEVGHEASHEDNPAVTRIISWCMATAWRACRVPLYVQAAKASPSWAKLENEGERVPADREAWETWRKGGELPLLI